MVPGPMQASSPTGGLWCGKAVISRLAAVPATGRRGGFHIRPGCLRQREARRDEGIPPYVRPDGRGLSGLTRNTKFIRRVGIYPARGTLRRRMVRRDEGIPPYVCPVGSGRSGLA